MCRKCQQHALLLFADAVLAKYPANAEAIPENLKDPFYSLALAAGAAGAGETDVLAGLTAQSDIDVYALTIKMMLELAAGLERLGGQMTGAMAHRIMITGEKTPEGFGIQAVGDPSELPPEIRQQMEKAGFQFGQEPGKKQAAHRPPDDNPELLARIFQNRPPKPGSQS